MKIINPFDKHVEFTELAVGDCFMFDDCLFVKIIPIKEKGYEKQAMLFVLWIIMSLMYLNLVWLFL